jgi:hypothetical protein
MTELDPNIVLKAFANPQLDVAGLMDQRAKAQREQVLQGRQDSEYAAQQAANQRAMADEQQGRNVVRQYGTDPTAARQSAFQTGDPGLVAKLDSMDAAGRKKAFDISQATAPLLMSLQKVPPAAIPQAMQSMAPQLVERGFTPEHVAQVQAALMDPAQRDAAFQGFLTSAQTIEQYTKSKEGFTLGSGQSRYNADGTQLAAEAQKPNVQIVEGPNGFYSVDKNTGTAAPVTVGGGAPSAGGAHYGPQIENVAKQLFPGVTVTSGMRSAAHNAEVGGVPNSFHTTNDARDLVPPQGVSMPQFASALKSKMPGYDVINEGSHVHIEPSPSMARSPAGGAQLQGKPPKNADPSAPMDAATIDYVAQQYKATGQLPPLGMGKQAADMRAQIIGRAAQLAKADGSFSDAAGLHADFKANSAALSTLQRYSSQVLASERTANMNADQVLQTMGQGAGTTGVPLLNAWQNRARNNLGGNPDVAKFNAAVGTFSTEYAKVVSGASGGAVTSDSARKEIQTMINGAQTPQQLQAVISQAKIEMANRKKGLSDQANALRDTMKSGQGAAGDKIPTFTPQQAQSAPKGTRFRTTDGRVMVRQ